MDSTRLVLVLLIGTGGCGGTDASEVGRDPAGGAGMLGGAGTSGGSSNPVGGGGSAVSAGGAGSGGGAGASSGNRDAAADAAGQADVAPVDSGGRCGTMYPAQCLNLMNWKLTLPIGSAGNPNEIHWPTLRTFAAAPYFQLNPSGPGVIFQANAGGVTSGNSEYPRCELREMTSDGKDDMAWSTMSGKHTMMVTEAFTHLPVAKPEAVGAQVHNDKDDVIMVRLNGSRLLVEHNGTSLGDLASTYKLGTFFNLKIEVTGGRIRVYHDDMTKPKIDEAESSGCGSSGSPLCYFKAGVYTQSNTSTGDNSAAYGEVIITALSVTHE
jgi:Alginate lyase